MSEHMAHDETSSGPLEVFQPKPGVLYDIDETARLAAVSRRSIMVYCRAGLVKPSAQSPHGTMGFTEEAIYCLRHIEHLHVFHDLDLAWIKEMFELREEVERLRAELRFLRKS